MDTPTRFGVLPDKRDRSLVKERVRNYEGKMVRAAMAAPTSNEAGHPHKTMA